MSYGEHVPVYCVERSKCKAHVRYAAYEVQNARRVGSYEE